MRPHAEREAYNVPLEAVVSDSRQNIGALLGAELAEEAASEFARLRRIPQTDIIWFLDHFSGLSAADRKALLHDLADSATLGFLPPSPAIPQAGPALARMCAAREHPGAKGGTRYMDMKMLCADRSLHDPAQYHESWRQHLTALHFQPRPDLVPAPSDMKAAKAPLVRKLVNAAITDSLGLKKEKIPGGVMKYTGRCGDNELIVRVDFGGMMSQLGYTLTMKNAAGQFLVVQLCYERLWGTSGRWDYMTEENAPRSCAFFAEQIAYLAKLAEKVHGGAR
jgi:hypothetical protein